MTGSYYDSFRCKEVYYHIIFFYYLPFPIAKYFEKVTVYRENCSKGPCLVYKIRQGKVTNTPRKTTLTLQKYGERAILREGFVEKAFKTWKEEPGAKSCLTFYSDSYRITTKHVENSFKYTKSGIVALLEPFYVCKGFVCPPYPGAQIPLVDRFLPPERPLPVIKEKPTWWVNYYKILK